MEFKINNTIDLKGLQKLEKSCRGINKRHIKFGWIDGKSYPASSDNAGIPIAQVAAWQEFGRGGNANTPAIPSRPYFRQAIDMAKQNYNKELKNIFLNVLYGTNTATSLEKLAGELVKDYSESVLMQNYQRLAPMTVAIKGHSYQMDDTGVMINNFKSRVYRTSLNNSRG